MEEGFFEELEEEPEEAIKRFFEEEQEKHRMMAVAAIETGKKDFTLYFIYNINGESFRDYYKQNNDNHHDLLVDIEKNYSGNFKDLLKALFQDPIEYDCSQLHKAMDGLGTNEDTLIEILVTRTPDIIRKIKEKYSKIYPKRNLVEDIKNDTSGFFRELLLSLLEAEDIKDKYNDNDAENLAGVLANDSYECWAEEDKFYSKIFTKTSKNDFNKIISFYDKKRKKPLKDLIQKNYSFNSKKLLKAIYYRETDPFRFFAKSIHKALSGFRIDYNYLTRLIVTQRNSKYNKRRNYFGKIEKKYSELYGENLFNEIKKKTLRSYSKLIMNLMLE